MGIDEDLFGFSAPTSRGKKRSRPVELAGHLWTEQKAILIAEYLHRFLMVTKTGVYLDLFAGPQSEAYDDDWSIKRVIERRDNGPNFKHFAACDIESEQVRCLERLRDAHAGRPFDFEIYYGDANERVHDMLSDAPIGAKMPCFCLIDQRTLECDWATVQTIADYRQNGYKIEIFYFLAEGWLDRSWQSTRDHEKLRRWWGADNFQQFLELRNVHRPRALCQRFRSDLGYKFSEPWSIHKQGESGRTMYYMIHASDHPDACRLMSEAYRYTQRMDYKTMTQTEMFRHLMPSDGETEQTSN